LTTRVRGRRIHHMKSSAVAAAVLSCVLASTAVLSAQLGDVARKEAERRKTAKQGKTYTNDTLKPAPEPSAAPASAGAQSGGAAPSDGAAPAPAPPPASSSPSATPPPPPRVSADPAQRKKDEAEWQGRVKAEREGLERAKTLADAMQSRINQLNTDFVNRDDPAQRQVIAADRDKAVAEMERLKKEVAEHTKAIAGIQEEARKAGVPPGWAR
jgi:hypothetical protein